MLMFSANHVLKLQYCDTIKDQACSVFFHDILLLTGSLCMIQDTERNIRFLQDLASRFLCLHGIWVHLHHSAEEHQFFL